MGLDTAAMVAAIERHSGELAEVAASDLHAPVVHCPGWDVADLLRHLLEVHWFWATIVEGHLQSPPEESERPPFPPEGELADAVRRRAAHLVEALAGADQQAGCWTWSPLQRDVAFVTRHQVQEAAVHHFDAALAVGQRIEIGEEVALDALEEFLTFSVSSEQDPAEPPRQPLRGSFDLACNDSGVVFHLSDGAVPGTVRSERREAASAPAIRASASDLLLFCYGRVEPDTSAVDPGLLERFRNLCFTD